MTAFWTAKIHAYGQQSNCTNTAAQWLHQVNSRSLYLQALAAPNSSALRCRSFSTWCQEKKLEQEGQTPDLALKATTITPVHRLPLALLTVPWNEPQEQCKPSRNRLFTISQQCSLCVKIVQAGLFSIPVLLFFRALSCEQTKLA